MEIKDSDNVALVFKEIVDPGELGDRPGKFDRYCYRNAITIVFFGRTA
jgi:hypothetical protein